MTKQEPAVIMSSSVSAINAINQWSLRHNLTAEAKFKYCRSEVSETKTK